MAYRCLVPAPDGTWQGDEGRAGVYLGPGAVLNRYPLRGGTLMNCVGIVQSQCWQEDGWHSPAERDEMLAHFADWHPRVVETITQSPDRTSCKCVPSK